MFNLNKVEAGLSSVVPLGRTQIFEHASCKVPFTFPCQRGRMLLLAHIHKVLQVKQGIISHAKWMLGYLLERNGPSISCALYWLGQQNLQSLAAQRGHRFPADIGIFLYIFSCLEESHISSITPHSSHEYNKPPSASKQEQ